MTLVWDKADKRVFGTNNSSSGDSNKRKLEVQILSNGNVEDLTASTLNLAWQTKDKRHFGLDAFTAIDAAKGIFEIYYTTGMLNNVGELDASLVIEDGASRVESGNFKITVYQSNANDELVQSDSRTEAFVQVNEWHGHNDVDRQAFINRAKAMKEQYLDRLNNIDTQLHMAINVNHMPGDTVDEQITNAFLEAEESGIGLVMIPSKANDGDDFNITKAIEIPSNMTLILNNAHLKLVSGVMDNMIVNKGARTTPLSSNENIYIIGVGNAIVDGLADVNKNFPGLAFKGPYHNDYRRIAINLFRTTNFSITNIKVRESQGYGISVENGCKHGLIRDIEIEAKDSVINQDGIDIRRGCSDIVIENISGVSGDDMIALNTMNNQKPPKDNSFQVGGGLTTYGVNNNIERIVIRNIKGYVAGRHNLIRILNKDGNKIKNIQIEHVEDTSTPEMNQGKSIITIGSSGYSTVSEDVLGDLSGITVNHVKATGNVQMVMFGSHAENVNIDNLYYQGNSPIGVLGVTNAGTKLKNIYIGTIEVEGHDKPINKDLHPYVFYLNDAEVEDLLIEKIIAKNVRYVLATNDYSTSVIQNMIVNEMYVDATAVNITLLRNPFDDERPSYLHNVFVKDIKDIYLDRESKNYREGEYFVSTKNLFIGNFSEGPHLLP